MGQRKRQNILIPQLNISSNDEELRIMQKKILANHYSQQINEHKNFSPKRSRYNPQQQDIADHRLLNKLYVDYERGVRNDLATSYDSQINLKNKIKRQAKQRQIRQEQQALKRLRQMQIQQYERSKLLNQSYKKQAMEIISKRQKQRNDLKKKEQQQKRLYRQRYSESNINLNKQRSFDEHFHNVSGVQNQYEKRYLQFVAPQNKIKQYERQKIVDDGIKKNELLLQNLIEKQCSDTNRQKYDLKETLEQQIREKQQQKRRQISQYKGQRYASEAYASRYHPIYNPVNFRITHDNKYVMKELQSHYQNEHGKGSESSKLSGLARSGSHAVLH